MAGNFWKSSHYEQWVLDKFDLLRERGEDFKVYNEEEYSKLMIFFCNWISDMAVKCPVSMNQSFPHQSTKFHQQVIATACVYFRRFYARRSFKDIDPFLLGPTCLVLASKVEEQGTFVSQSKFASYVQGVVFNLFKRYSMTTEFVIKSSHLQEAEFILLEVMDCCLVVYQPYRPLVQLINDMKTAGVRDTELLYQDAWRVCNDSSKTDACLLYYPHMIALGAVMVASLWQNREKDKELNSWFTDFSVDFERIFDVVRIMLELYRLLKSYDDNKQMEDLLKKLPRPQLQTTSSTSGSIKIDALTQQMHKKLENKF
ncbi:Cyclin-C [Aphelenchoides bicaudatus]|nr:Cyclin-C [Aphelenchoides bicaudatus]